MTVIDVQSIDWLFLISDNETKYIRRYRLGHSACVLCALVDCLHLYRFNILLINN